MNALQFSNLYQEDLYQFANPLIVVLPRAWDTYNIEEKMLLCKILGSVKMDLSASQMVVQPALSLNDLNVFTPARVLVFGSDTAEAITFYQATPAQGFIVIRADDLSQLDDQKKKNLWSALRQMFGI